MSTDSALSIVTTNVCGHEVPLPAYWRIVELWQQGMSIDGIIQRVMNLTGFSGYQTISTIVTDIVDNQMRLLQSSMERRIVPVTTQSPLQIVERGGIYRSPATHRASRRAQKSEAQTTVEDARNNLQAALLREQELSKAAEELMRSRGRFSKDLQLQDRWHAEAAIDRETRRVLEKRQAAEEEVVRLRKAMEECKQGAKWI